MLDTVVPLLTAKLKLLAVGVAAVALSSSAVAVTTVSSEEPAVETAVAAVEPAPADELAVAVPEDAAVATDTAGGRPEVVAPPAAPVELPPCPADVTNHGEYVSSVARDKTVTGAAHGARVSAAAQSDCGKKAGDEAEVEPTEVEEPEEPRTAQDEAAKAAAKAEKAAEKAARAQARADAGKGRPEGVGNPAGAGKDKGKGKGGGGKG